MDTSILLARIMGPVFMTLALGMVINFPEARRLFQDFVRSRGLIYLGGLMVLILGLLLVNVHNVWAVDWRVVITITAWLSVAKGLGLLLFPGALAFLAEKYLENKAILVVQACFLLGLGVLLTVLGYLT